MDVAYEPGRYTNRDIDAEITQFIERRHETRVKNEGERAAEESWKESVRNFNAAREAEEHQMRIAWYRHLRDVYACRGVRVSR